MPRLGMPRLATGTRIAVAFEQNHLLNQDKYLARYPSLQGSQIVTSICSEATVILVPITKRGVSKRGILKSLVSHVLNFKSWSNSFMT